MAKFLLKRNNINNNNSSSVIHSRISGSALSYIHVSVAHRSRICENFEKPRSEAYFVRSIYHVRVTFLLLALLTLNSLFNMKLIFLYIN